MKRTKRKRRDDRDQTRLDLKPGYPSSDLDREVREFAEESRREPLPGQAGLLLEGKP